MSTLNVKQVFSRKVIKNMPDNEKKVNVNLLDRITAMKYYSKTGQVEVTKEFPEESYLWNKDFHPTPVTMRNWGGWTYMAIWFGMVAIVPTWTLSGVGLLFGLNWWQAIFLMFLGNAIVLVPMIIQSHGGARYGMSEPQLTRSRWGIYGAQIPSWIRAIISMGWWGIETYIITEAAVAMYILATGRIDMLLKGSTYTLSVAFPSIFWPAFVVVVVTQIALFYISPPYKGQPALKWLARIAAPIVLIGFLLLFFFTMGNAKWDFLPVLQIPATAKGFGFWLAALGFLNANVAYWATMALSMPDFTRFAKSQRSQTWGQIPMPLMMAAIGALGILTTGATMALGLNGGHGIADPVILAAVMLPKDAAYFVLFVFMLATFVVNVYANSVAPGYDIANTYSKHLTWFRGIVIGIVISMLIGAWTFYSGGAYSYINNWLLAYGALLGAVEGVIVFDYAIIRRFKFEAVDSYLKNGRFRYWHGVNPAAVIAFIIGVVVTYLAYWGWVVNPVTQLLYANSWISAFLISGVVDIILMKFWVIPKYQPFLKGGLLHGYISDEVKKLFEQNNN
ncbi:MAG: cytosine permease [Nitrososphaeria archaeon]